MPIQKDHRLRQFHRRPIVEAPHRPCSAAGRDRPRTATHGRRGDCPKDRDGPRCPFPDMTCLGLPGRTPALFTPNFQSLLAVSRRSGSPGPVVYDPWTPFQRAPNGSILRVTSDGTPPDQRYRDTSISTSLHTRRSGGTGQRPATQAARSVAQLFTPKLRNNHRDMMCGQTWRVGRSDGTKEAAAGRISQPPTQLVEEQLVETRASLEGFDMCKLTKSLCPESETHSPQTLKWGTTECARRTS